MRNKILVFTLVSILLLISIISLPGANALNASVLSIINSKAGIVYYSCSLQPNSSVTCLNYNIFEGVDDANNVSVSSSAASIKAATGSLHSCSLLPNNSVSCGRTMTVMGKPVVIQ